MSAEKSSIEAELRSMGACHPSLWITLYDVNQAIHSSKPLPEMPDWNSVCSTVQDLYRLSYKDPREFAIVQNLTTIMHQQQAKEEILNRISAIPSGPTDAPETRKLPEDFLRLLEMHHKVEELPSEDKAVEILENSVEMSCKDFSHTSIEPLIIPTDIPETNERPKESLQLSEIQTELNELCSKVKELGKAVDDFKNVVTLPDKDVLQTSTEPFIIPLEAIEKIHKYLYSLPEGNVSQYTLAKRLGFHYKWVSQELSKAKEFKTIEIPTIDDHYKSISDTTQIIQTAYKHAFPIPRTNVYQEIRKALEASFIIKKRAS